MCVMCLCMCVYVYMCVCVCVCVRVGGVSYQCTGTNNSLLDGTLIHAHLYIC